MLLCHPHYYFCFFYSYFLISSLYIFILLDYSMWILILSLNIRDLTAFWGILLTFQHIFNKSHVTKSQPCMHALGYYRVAKFTWTWDWTWNWNQNLRACERDAFSMQKDPERLKRVWKVKSTLITPTQNWRIWWLEWWFYPVKETWKKLFKNMSDSDYN